MAKPCQTIDFNEDWHVISILRIFAGSDTCKLLSQEEIMRRAGINKYALETAVKRINSRIKSCIISRPEYDSLPKIERMNTVIGDFWLAVDDFMVYGKWTFNDRKGLGYKLADNVEIVRLSSNNIVLRVYKNGD